MSEVKPLLSPEVHCAAYWRRLADVMETFDWTPVGLLAEELLDCWRTRRQVFFIGNGGSCGNAVHLANDLIYAISKRHGSGLKAHALGANQSVLTCLANDEGYDKIYSMQLAVMAHPDDVLIAFSGSGNSPNIIAALDEARKIGMRSYAVLGYSGGKAKALADTAIHLPIDDMQIAEDAQLIFGHMIMQWLAAHRDHVTS